LLRPALFPHLPQCLREFLLAAFRRRLELPLTLSQSTRRQIGRLTRSIGLVSGDEYCYDSEHNQKDLRRQDSYLDCCIPPFVFGFVFSLGIAGGIFTILWSWEDGNGPFVARWRIFVASMLVAQWGGLRFLEWFFGRIMKRTKHEYHEGPKGGENFQKLARAVLQAANVAVPKKQPKAKPTARKTHGSEQGWNGSSFPVPAAS